MRFTDRDDAGRQLAEALAAYRGKDAVVYALPRGGVPLGAHIADALNVPLDLVIARKIGHPLSAEYAVCAVSLTGELLCDEEASRNIDPEWLQSAVEREQKEARRRRDVYVGGRGHIPAAGKIAIVVDDGVATGLTLRAALRSIRAETPKELVAAVPVAPHDAVAVMRREVDTLVVLHDDRNYLGSVGAYYDEFPQISDEEVMTLLEKHAPAVHP